MGVRSVAIKNFGEMSDRAIVEEFSDAVEVGACGGFGGVAVYFEQGFDVGGEGPHPRCAVVVSGFATGVFIAEVMSPIGVERVVEEASVIVDGERIFYRTVR